MMSKQLDEIVEQLKASGATLDASLTDSEAQRRSFAYGTANIENSAVTRDMVDHEADRFDTR